MQKKLTITIDAQVYEGLRRVIGPRRISRFIETVVRPHVLREDLREGYRQMAADEERETEALEWAEATVGDVSDEAMKSRLSGRRYPFSAARALTAVPVSGSPLPRRLNMLPAR